ncbi:MAG: penicillin-binding protein [Lactobacillaceae bacterium]|jgi:penicillin-binding protein 1A|nr:penicillin-binding protein [Lactobacillaceae bacterium]
MADRNNPPYNGNLNNGQNPNQPRPYNPQNNANQNGSRYFANGQNVNRPINPTSKEVQNEIARNVAGASQPNANPNNQNAYQPRNGGVNPQQAYRPQNNNQPYNPNGQSAQTSQPATKNQPVNRTNSPSNNSRGKQNNLSSMVSGLFKNKKNAPKTGDNGDPNTPKKPKQKLTRKQLIWKISKWFATAIDFFELVGMALFFTYAASAPNITEAQLASSTGTQMLDSNQNVIWTSSNQDRDYADQSEIPTKLKHAVVAIEDRRFYKHHGVDLIRTIGSALSTIRYKLHLGGRLEGGSTLTQQLVKLSVFSTAASDQTLKRKAQEAWLAMKVERNFSKDQILTFYINKVNMGQVYGMKTAAKYYFGKDLKDLTDSQYAILAAIPNAPFLYNLYTNPEGVTNRRNLVLDAEVSMGYLTAKQAADAKAQSVTEGLIPADDHTAASSSDALLSDSYIQSTLKELKNLGYDPYKDNLRIYTNENTDFQQAVVDNLNSNIFKEGSEAAATLMDTNSGKVLAQVGGRNVDIQFGLNRAVQTNRSTGSSIKPVIDYGPAIEYLNWPTYRTLQDKKIYYKGTNIQVRNYDLTYHGNVTMRQALKMSYNVPAVETFDAVGVTNVSKFLNGLGLTNQASDLYSSEAIGYNASTLQMAAAYSAFANGGTYYAPQYISKIVTADGQTHSYESTGTTAMKDSTAFMITDMLKTVVTSSGSGYAAAGSGLNIVGKTGQVAYDSSLNMPDRANSDIWFSGYSKNFALSIWNGFDSPNAEGHYLDGVTAAASPSMAFKYIMEAILAGRADPDWTMPASVEKVTKAGQTEYEVKGAKWDDDGLPQLGDSSFTSTSAVPDGADDSTSDSSSSGTESSTTTSSYGPSTSESGVYDQTSTTDDQTSTTDGTQ